MPSRNKGGAVLTIFAVIAVIILLFIVTAYFSPEFFAPLALSKMRQDHPSLMLTPKPMQLVSPAPVQPERLSSYGYEFQTPWGKPLDVQLRKDFKSFAFPDNVQMFAYNPEKAFDFLDFAIIASSMPDEGRRAFGRSDIDSYFEAMRCVLEIVPPSHVSLFGNRKQMMATYEVLMYKSMVVQDTVTEILAFELGSWRGFQMNRPKQNAKSVVFLFDKQFSGLEFSFSRIGDNQDKSIPQAEINAVLLSLRPASPAQKPPPKSEK